MPGDIQTRFVVLEGLDGSGTTTQARLLADALRARDQQVCLTAEPSDGLLGRVARAHVRGEVTLDPVTAALTFTADRSDHLARLVRPRLQAGAWVVCDRYLLSTLAYQGADGVDPEWILALSRDFEVPVLTVFLDLPEAARTARLSGREAMERYELPQTQERVRRAYQDTLARLRVHGHPIETVSSAGTVKETARAVLSRVDSLPGQN